MKKSALVIYDSKYNGRYSRYEQYVKAKGELTNWMRTRGFAMLSKMDFKIEYELMDFLFLDLSKNNADRFISKQDKLNHIHAFVDILPEEIIRKLTKIAPEEPIEYNSNGERLSRLYEQLHDKVKVYSVEGYRPSKVAEKEVYSYQRHQSDNGEKRFATLAEAREYLTNMVAQRIIMSKNDIKLAEKRVLEDENLLKKLTKK